MAVSIYLVSKIAGLYKIGIPQMRLAIINDYEPIQRRPFLGNDWFRLCDISFGSRNMGNYKVYAMLILFGYGFQLRSR